MRLLGTVYIVRNGVPSKPFVMTFDVVNVDMFKASAEGVAFGPHGPGEAVLEFGPIGEPWRGSGR